MLAVLLAAPFMALLDVFIVTSTRPAPTCSC
jgi:hypothetical protein